MMTLLTPSGRPFRRKTSLAMFWQAMAQRGVLLDGFQTATSPQAQARALFHAHTATGKLKAVTTPMMPSGCHCSIMRCMGRSLCSVGPEKKRLWPTAKSQMSIISCTSPRPSVRILPISSETSRPRSSFFSRRASPSWRTTSPRRGAGTARQATKAFSAWRMTLA